MTFDHSNCSKYDPSTSMHIQELKDSDFEQRVLFCDYVLQQNRNDSRWSNSIGFSDEATFHLNGRVNMHNCFYYSVTNSHITETKPMRSPSVCVWAMITYRHGIIHHVFDGNVNGERYSHLLETVVLPFLRRKQNIIFQQDGAPVHYSSKVGSLLDENLPHRWIGRGSTISWPPRSPDLAMNDF